MLAKRCASWIDNKVKIGLSNPYYWDVYYKPWNRASLQWDYLFPSLGYLILGHEHKRKPTQLSPFQFTHSPFLLDFLKERAQEVTHKPVGEVMSPS